MAEWIYMKYNDSTWGYLDDVKTYVQKLETHGYEIEDITEHKNSYHNGGYTTKITTGATISFKDRLEIIEKEVDFASINVISCKKCGITVTTSKHEDEDELCCETCHINATESSKAERRTVHLIIINGEAAPVDDYGLSESGNIAPNSFPRWYSKRDTTKLSLEDLKRLTDNELLHVTCIRSEIQKLIYDNFRRLSLYSFCKSQSLLDTEIL